MNLTPEDKLILSCIKIHPSAEELAYLNALIPTITDWEYLKITIIDRGIGPLLFKKLSLLSNSSLIPETVKIKLQQAYYKTFGRSVVMYDCFQMLGEAFASHNIQIIALKGVYLSEWLYQDIGLRQFSDIDLLVNEEVGLNCIELLEELGFKPYDSNVTEYIGSKAEIIHYFPMVLNGVSVEIHIKLHRSTEKYHLQIKEFWKNAVPVTLNRINVFALNNDDLLIHLCTHLDKHFRVGHVQFTCFNDITNLLEKIVDSINWDDFIGACRLHQCEDVVFMYIVMVNKYINATVPEHIIANYSHLLTEVDKILFIKYLNGHIGEFTAVPVHIGNLKLLTSFSNKFRYISELIFPPKAFMIVKYGLTPNPLKGAFWWLWYPYRWWIGVKGVLRVFSGK